MDNFPCAVCGSPSPFFVRNGTTGRDFFRCRNCGYIFVPPDAARLSAEEERKFFKGQWQRSPDGGNTGCYPTVLSLAQTCGISPLKALDFGCGNGGLVRRLRENGIPAYGVDRVPVDNDMRPFVFPALDDLPDMKFGLITAIEVFEHLPRPVEALEGLLARLAPDGFLFLTTALTNRAMAHLKFFPHWIYQNDPTHIGFFAEKTFEWLGAKYGLELQVFGYGDFILDRSGKRLVVQHENKFVFHLQDKWETNF